MKEISYLLNLIINSRILKNSLWGVSANVFQILFTSILFVIVARNYESKDFAHFILATTVYQIFVSVSTLNLGQWFIREYSITENKVKLSSKFLKIQLTLGLFFYLLNIAFAIILFKEAQIRSISYVFGANIIFDNLIYAISRINIADSKQRNTAIVIITDGLLKLLIAGLLYLYPFSIVYLSFFLIIGRFLTLNILIKISSVVDIRNHLLWNARITIGDIKELIISNWRFIIVGGIYVINWRIANIFISKFLPLHSVSEYEIAYKIYSVALVLPMIVSTTIYPTLIKSSHNGEYATLRYFYNTAFFFYTIYSMYCYALILTFSNSLIPYVFGLKYLNSVHTVQLMFLTLFVATTGSLQANLLISLRLENYDLKFNLFNICINILCCMIGFYFFKTIDVINFSILAAVTCFHLMQDTILIRRKFKTLKNTIINYLIIIIFIITYNWILKLFNSYILFVFFSLFVLTISITAFYKLYRRNLRAIV